MKKALFVIFLCLSVCFFTISAGVGTSVAEDTPATDERSPNSAIAGEEEGSPWTLYFRPGVRWGTDDRTLFILDFLVPIYQGKRNIVFFNPKFTPNNHEGWEVNLGLGYRHLLLDELLVLGINGFYDTRRTDWGTYHRQWGLGAEVMTELPVAEAWDLGLTGRINGYFGLTSPRVEGLGSPLAHYFFKDIGIYLESGRVEEALSGLDAEVGLRIPYLSDYVETWFYAGGYHYEGKYVADVNGLMTRLEVIPTDFLRLSFEYRNDNINHDEFFGEVALEIPFSIDNLMAGKNPFEGIGERLGGSRELKKRLFEPVRRDVDIRVVVDDENTNIPEIGGFVEEAVFVSETALPGTGDGSYENPYASITEAMTDANSRIVLGTATTTHVINDDPGSGTAGGGTVNVANLLVWGSGANHPRYPLISNMTPGYPTIDSTLYLSEANLTAMGLNIEFNGPRGIDIQNGTGVIIRDNIINITNSGGNAYGIYGGLGSIGSESNPLLINSNNITVNSSDSSYGIFLAGGSGLFAEITNNDMTGIEGEDYAFGIELFSTTGTIGSATRPVLIDSNTMTLTATNWDTYGINIHAGVSGLFAEITNNNMTRGLGITSTDAVGIYLISSGDIGSAIRPLLIDNNTMSCTDNSNGAFGMYLLGNASIFAEITDNDMTGGIEGDNYAYGIYMRSSGIGSATRPVLIYNNPMTVTATNQNAHGIYIFAGSGGLFADISNNRSMNVTSNLSNAWGALLETNAVGLIGNSTTHTLFQNNSGIINGSTYRYMLGLVTGDPNGGNYVDWSGNTFTAVGGGWSGNYPLPGPGPVFENFNEGGNDWLNP
jgi:hypothetical protein